MASDSCAEITIRIINFDDMVYDCEAIIEICLLLGISPALMEAWLNQYLSENIEIFMGR